MPEAIQEPGSKPKLLILSFSPIIRDPRVLRQIRMFSGAYEIISCGYGAAPDGVARHIEIPRSMEPWRPSFKSLAFLLAMRLHDRLYFGSERVQYVLKALAPTPVDIVLANDAIAAPLAMSLNPRSGVHVDLHEYAPRQGENSLQWRLLVGPFMHWATKHHVTRANSTSTVAEGIAAEYARVYGLVKPDVVPNATSYRDDLSPTPVQTPLRIIHTGVAGRARRIEEMIDAVAQANELEPGRATLDLVLVPGDQKYIDELTEQASAVPADAVKVLPPVPFQQIVPMLHQYDVGLFICPPSTFNLLHALPNKLFEFIQARLAVIIGPSPEMERVVRQHSLGRVSEDFTAATTARLIAGLTAEEVLVMKQASHHAARELSAENLSEPWAQAIDRLASREKDSAGSN